MNENGLLFRSCSRHLLRLEHIDTLHQGTDDFCIQFLDLGILLDLCEEGIKLYRIRESLSSLNSTSIDFVIKNTKEDLSDVIRRILNDILKAEVDVDLQRDFLAIEQLRVYSEKSQFSLVFKSSPRGGMELRKKR